MRGMYDLVFAYVDGDRGRPQFCAGLGLFLAGKFFFDTTTLAAGYRFQHVSNASMCDLNVGLNSSALYLGVSYRFR